MSPQRLSPWGQSSFPGVHAIFALALFHPAVADRVARGDIVAFAVLRATDLLAAHARQLGGKSRTP